jgi:hypothetical protein
MRALAPSEQQLKVHTDATALDKLRMRIQGLRAKTIANGCTEGEALSAAAKVAELLDRHDLSLTDVEIGRASCEQRAYETHRRKRIPIDDCIGAIADFCDCRVWRERSRSGERRYIFFGLRADVDAAHFLTELIDGAVRFELGRYKVGRDYQRLPHKARHEANASFMLGMVASIADKLTAMKARRDEASRGTGRELVVRKAIVVDAELEKLGVTLRAIPGAGRMVSLDAYEAGGVAGASLAIARRLRD